MKFSKRLLVAVATTGIVVSSCSSNSTSDSSSTTASSVTIATAFYPITEIARRITSGTDVAIVSLTPAGVGAHDHQLTAQQLDELATADAVFYLGSGLQPSVEKAVTQLSSSVVVVDLLESATTLSADDTTVHSDEHGDEHGDEHSADEPKTTTDTHSDEKDEHAHGDVDPHVWLDPANMVRMANAVLSTLSTLSSSDQKTFEDNASTYVAELNALGSEIDQTFATCESRVLVTSHDAFGYFAARAKLDTVPIAGVNPENEPSAKELEEIATVAREAGASTVFFETLLPDGLAKTLASAIDAKVDVIDPIETLSESALADGQDYLSAQRQNIQKISAGLRCS